MTHQRRRRRHSAVCHRHPSSKPTTGFCATCLRERLATIEALSSSPAASVADEELIGSSIRISMVPDLKEEEEEEEQKTMKEFIDLESRNHQTKKNNGSVFSRTLMKFSLKHGKNPDAAGNSQVLTQTGLGRRSCDVYPRLSLDGVRISFEEPRASWDGCLIGKTTYPKLIPLSAVTEDAKTSPEKNPGGTAQTRDYYLDSRRRKSFDRSTRHGLLEIDELKSISNAKVSPESVGLFHGAKLLVTERELRDSNWYSIKNYKPESLELGSKGVTCVVAAAGEVKQDGFRLKKSGKKWSKGWNFWGLIQRKTDTSKNEIKTEQSLKLGGNAMEGSLAESLLKLRRVAKGETNGDVSEKLVRSYSVSARKSCDGGSIVNGFEGGRSSCDGLFHGSITGVETGRRRSSCEDGLFRGSEGQRNHLLQREAKLGTYSPDKEPCDKQLREK